MSDFEKRGGLHGVEARATEEKRTLVGYAAIFNSDTTISDYFVERIAPGAFAETITGDIRALVDHDTAKVIGRTRSRTLRLSEDTRGLRVEIDIPNNTVGNDLWVSVEREDISGMSFGFRVTKQEWDESGDMPVRTIRGVELFEVSAVAFPAYDDTTIGLRSLEAARAEGGNAHNAAAARRRVAEKRAAMEQRIRGIRQEAS
ncbi:HK97 family phage prohead protease [Ensifer canadensis]|uniref:HK97 family phage prohead protease n=1 Tax=Ensifer canadensis TaxID=555315 RepID=UPI0035E3DA13